MVLFRCFKVIFYNKITFFKGPLHIAFFIEEVSQERFHEICIYYLLDGSALPDGNFFHREEGHANHFEWVSFQDLRERYFYPELIKERIFRLPDHLEILIENRI